MLNKVHLLYPLLQEEQWEVWVLYGSAKLHLFQENTCFDLNHSIKWTGSPFPRILCIQMHFCYFWHSEMPSRKEICNFLEGRNVCFLFVHFECPLPSNSCTPPVLKPFSWSSFHSQQIKISWSVLPLHVVSVDKSVIRRKELSAWPSAFSSSRIKIQNYTEQK